MAVEEVKRIQFPRESTAKNDAYVGVPGEITVDSTREELRLHDGKTAGGWRLPNITQLRNLFVSTASDVAKMVFSASARGIVTRIGNGSYALRQLTGTELDIAINNANGVDGNPVFSVHERIAADQTTQRAGYNDITSTGFYTMAGTASNRPAGIGTEIGALTVFRHTTVNGDIYILQRVTALSAAVATEYKRWRIAGSWSAWV